METLTPLSNVKYRLIDFFSWLALGVALLLFMRVLGPFSLVSGMGNAPAGSEGKAMLEMLCFVAGLSAILVAVSHAFSKDFREETANMKTPPARRVERRHERHARIGVLMISGFLFSLAGLVVWLLPLDADRKALSPVLSMILVVAFALMTLLTAGGALLSMRRQRLFDRRHALA